MGAMVAASLSILLSTSVVHAYPKHVPLAQSCRVVHPYVRSAAPCMTATTAATPLELLEERRLGELFERAFQKPSAIIDVIRGAGLSGAIAYFISAVVFYSIASSIGEAVYHSASGQWVDPRVLLLEDGAQEKAETLALIASFYLLCKPFAPLRLGGALLLTPDVQRFIQARPALVAAVDAAGDAWDGTVGVTVRAVGTAVAPLASALADSPVVAPLRRELLKSELLDLAEQADGGLTTLDEASQSRLDELATSLLPALNPTAAPCTSDKFSAEWECRWTNEKELNFARESGLFGLPWVRTYQSIDMTAGTLINVLEFEEGGELRVGSSIAPDAANGARFDFAFRGCALRWKSIEVPLPPVGRGWGELLYLDDDVRIQRDIRGDLLIAERVGPPIAE